MVYGNFHSRNKRPIISNQITKWEILSSQFVKEWEFSKVDNSLKNMTLTKSKNNKPTSNITTLHKFIIKIH